MQSDKTGFLTGIPLIGLRYIHNNDRTNLAQKRLKPEQFMPSGFW
nr:hypothetical protein [Sedimenticola selenatireducens]